MGILTPETLMMIAQVDHDWNYFRFSNRVTAEMIPTGSNTFELVLLVRMILDERISGAHTYIM
jgi:hypothetical protein